eukprot:3100299-Amphidinium_carterae.1
MQHAIRFEQLLILVGHAPSVAYPDQGWHGLSASLRCSPGLASSRVGLKRLGTCIRLPVTFLSNERLQWGCFQAALSAAEEPSERC